MSWRETVVMWWSGMRGVASVALALAVPLEMDNGEPFPGRDVILFVAFTVVIVTLVVQGLTLPWLVRRLDVRRDADRERELEHELARRAHRAAKERLREIQEQEELPEELADQLARRAYEMEVRIAPDLIEDERREAHQRKTRRARRIQEIQGEMLSAARHEMLEARNDPGSDPELVDRVLHRLDVRSLRR